MTANRHVGRKEIWWSSIHTGKDWAQFITRTLNFSVLEAIHQLHLHPSSLFTLKRAKSNNATFSCEVPFLRTLSALHFPTEKEIFNSVLPQFVCVYPNNLIWGEKNQGLCEIRVRLQLSTYQAAPTEFSRQEKPVLFCQNARRKQERRNTNKVKHSLLLTGKSL